MCFHEFCPPFHSLSPFSVADAVPLPSLRPSFGLPVGPASSLPCDSPLPSSHVRTNAADSPEPFSKPPPFWPSSGLHYFAIFPSFFSNVHICIRISATFRFFSIASLIGVTMDLKLFPFVLLVIFLSQNAPGTLFSYSSIRLQSYDLRRFTVLRFSRRKCLNVYNPFTLSPHSLVSSSLPYPSNHRYYVFCLFIHPEPSVHLFTFSVFPHLLPAFFPYRHSSPRLSTPKCQIMYLFR